MVFFLIEKEKIKEYNVNVLGGEPKNILKRRKYKMKKMIKKIAAAFMAMALVAVGMLAANKAEVKAATNVKLYFNTTDPTNYGANVWGGATATGGANVQTWDASQNGPSLVEDNTKQGWSYITIDDTSNVQGIQIVKMGSALTTSEDNNNLWNAQIASQNLTEAYFDVNTGKWYREAALTNEILPPVLDEIFYVVGDAALVGEAWAATSSLGLMTETATDVHTKTFTNVAAGTYNFKVLQDPADFAWDRVVWNDAYPGTGGNMGITVAELSDVTFKVTVGNTNTLTVTVTPVQDDEEETTTAADDDEDETTTAADDDDENTTTTAAADDDDETTAADDDDDETTAADDEEDTNTYHVAGEAGLCGEAWNPAANQMTKNDDGTWSIKFTNVKAGTYAFKVATNGAWDNGEYNLDGDASNNGPNASITVEEDGTTVIISFDGEKAIITMNAVPAGGGEDTPAGDSSMVAIFAILAVLAAAGVVTVAVAKRRAIEE